MIKERKKRSLIWKIKKELLEDLVKKSITFSEILLYFGLSNKGGNCGTLKNRLKYDNIDFSHIPQGLNSGKGLRRGGVKMKPLSEILTVNSTLTRRHLKRRLIKEKIINYQCNMCGLKPYWNNDNLVLILDHINGIGDDCRVENLRFLCPNCNSQTPTFAGRNKKYLRSSNGRIGLFESLNGGSIPSLRTNSPVV